MLKKMLLKCCKFWLNKKYDEDEEIRKIGKNHICDIDWFIEPKVTTVKEFHTRVKGKGLWINTFATLVDIFKKHFRFTISEFEFHTDTLAKTNFIFSTVHKNELISMLETISLTEYDLSVVIHNMGGSLCFIHFPFEQL